MVSHTAGWTSGLLDGGCPFNFKLFLDVVFALFNRSMSTLIEEKNNYFFPFN